MPPGASLAQRPCKLMAPQKVNSENPPPATRPVPEWCTSRLHQKLSALSQVVTPCSAALARAWASDCLPSQRLHACAQLLHVCLLHAACNSHTQHICTPSVTIIPNLLHTTRVLSCSPSATRCNSNPSSPTAATHACMSAPNSTMAVLSRHGSRDLDTCTVGCCHCALTCLRAVDRRHD